MKPFLLVGMHLNSAAPVLIGELKKHFEVCVLDFRDVSMAMGALAGKSVSGVVTRLEYYTFFSMIASLLTPTGTTFGHCLAWEHGVSELSQDDLYQIGLCACINVSEDAQRVAAQVQDVCESCRHHPSPLLLDHSIFGEGHVDGSGMVHRGVDDRMADLVAHGFSDQAISEILHFSNQTIRNRMSRLLRSNGFENRTELGNARLRHSARTYMEQGSQYSDELDI